MLSLPIMEKRRYSRMFVSKILNILCAFLLMVCLCISVTTLCSLRNALDEHQQLRENAEQLLRELDQSVLVMNAIADPPAEEPNVPQEPLTDETQEHTVYRIRSVGQSIGVYAEDGTLLRVLDVNPKTLPMDIQQILHEGMTISSREELLGFLQDLTS